MNKFNNYQLYKTSVLLGGQMKYDLVLDTRGNDLYVSDFHITPISSYVPFNRHDETNLLLYPHQYNIRDFYKKTVSSFFENFVESQMNHNWPVVDDSKIYDDTFYSGCSRMKYNIYNKQFEFFCPLWLEKIGDNSLVFDINVKTKSDSKCNVASKTLILNTNGIECHNNFVKYINDYFKYIGIDKGNDDVININLFKKSASLRGVDLQSGNIVSLDLSDLPDNLISRERPLLESNYLITSSYMDTKTIIPNLFNINLCFNLEDVFTTNIIRKIQGKSLYISIDVRLVDDNKNTIETLEKRDIYTNHEYIPKKQCNPITTIYSKYFNDTVYDYSTDQPNVLDYMNDHKFISNIDKNKIVQKIPHWQLNNNDSYLFNLYEGFRGHLNERIGIVIFEDPDYTYISEQPVNEQTWIISKGKGIVRGETLIIDEGEKIQECYNRYADTPDLLQPRYSKSLNNIGWSRCVYLDGSTLEILYNNPNIVDRITTELTPGWNGYLYYNTHQDEPFRILLGYCKEKSEYSKVKLSLKQNDNQIIDYGDLIVTNIMGTQQKTLLICSTDLNKLTFANIKQMAFNYKSSNNNIKQSSNNNIKQLYYLLNNVRPQSLVTMNNRLGIMTADSPDPMSTEIEYKKINTNLVYVLRYDGKIKPSMVPLDCGFKNYIYNKKRLSDISKDDPFLKYTESGFQPLYPSIGYWAYDKQFIDYARPPKYVDSFEYKWFDNSKILYTKSELEFNISSKLNTKEYINEQIKHKISIETGINDDDLLTYIINLYDIYYNLTDNINDKYNYYIYMKFK